MCAAFARSWSAFSTSARTRPARLGDNGEWLDSMSAIEFLREVGKHFTVNFLLAKESVKAASTARKAFRTPSSATCCCKPTTFSCCTIATRDGRRRAAPTVGEHRRRCASSSRTLRGVEVHGDAADHHGERARFGKTEAGAVGSIRTLRRRIASISSGSTRKIATS